MARKIDHKMGVLTLSANTVLAITSNPPAGIVGGGLFGTLDPANLDNVLLSQPGYAVDGIIPHNALAGHEVAFEMDGIPLVRLGGTVANRAYLQAGANGVAVTWDGISPVAGRTITGGVINDYVSCILAARPDEVLPSGGVLTTIASGAAAVVTPPFRLFIISGAAALTGFTATGFVTGDAFTVIPTGAFTWTNAGNIAVAGTAVVSRSLTFTWDATTVKWYPSYV